MDDEKLKRLQRAADTIADDINKKLKDQPPMCVRLMTIRHRLNQRGKPLSPCEFMALGLLENGDAKFQRGMEVFFKNTKDPMVTFDGLVSEIRMRLGHD
jgi:hypothetical protein